MTAGRPAWAELAVSVSVEWAAWCNGAEHPDGIRLAQTQFRQPEAAVDWARSKVGQYGIVGYRLASREHYLFAADQFFESASTPWVESPDPAHRFTTESESR